MLRIKKNEKSAVPGKGAALAGVGGFSGIMVRTG